MGHIFGLNNDLIFICCPHILIETYSYNDFVMVIERGAFLADKGVPS